GRVLGRAAAVAFIDDDQVKETARKLAKELLLLFRPGNRLIKAEINLIGRVDAAALVDGRGQFDLRSVRALDGLGVGAELGHRLAEGAKVVDHGLVDEDISIREEEDTLLPARLP